LALLEMERSLLLLLLLLQLLQTICCQHKMGGTTKQVTHKESTNVYRTDSGRNATITIIPLLLAYLPQPYQTPDARRGEVRQA
jgi:hypothetical protein